MMNIEWDYFYTGEGGDIQLWFKDTELEQAHYEDLVDVPLTVTPNSFEDKNGISHDITVEFQPLDSDVGTQLASVYLDGSLIKELEWSDYYVCEYDKYQD